MSDKPLDERKVPTDDDKTQWKRDREDYDPSIVYMPMDDELGSGKGGPSDDAVPDMPEDDELGGSRK